MRAAGSYDATFFLLVAFGLVVFVLVAFGFAVFDFVAFGFAVFAVGVFGFAAFAFAVFEFVAFAFAAFEFVLLGLLAAFAFVVFAAHNGSQARVLNELEKLRTALICDQISNHGAKRAYVVAQRLVFVFECDVLTAHGFALGIGCLHRCASRQ